MKALCTILSLLVIGWITTCLANRARLRAEARHNAYMMQSGHIVVRTWTQPEPPKPIPTCW